MLILREGLLLLRMFQKSWSEKTQQPVAAWQSSLSGALAGDFVVSQVLLTILGYSRSALIFKDFFEGKKKRKKKIVLNLCVCQVCLVSSTVARLRWCLFKWSFTLMVIPSNGIASDE